MVRRLKKKKAEWPVGHSRKPIPNWETENGDSRSLSSYAGARRDGLWSSFAGGAAGDHPIAVGEQRQGEVSTPPAMFFLGLEEYSVRQ
jgi:hypothetical protein